MKVNEEKKYLLPQRVSPTKVELHEVSKELYESISKDINTLRKRAQRNGECACPREKLWQCDGCCVDCPFYHKNTVSFSDVVYKDDKGENDITYEDITPDKSFRNTPEGIIFNSLVAELQDALSNIDPSLRAIFDAIYEKTITNNFESLRSVAEELGIHWATFHDKLDIVRELYKKYFSKN